MSKQYASDIKEFLKKLEEALYDDNSGFTTCRQLHQGDAYDKDRIDKNTIDNRTKGTKIPQKKYKRAFIDWVDDEYCSKTGCKELLEVFENNLEKIEPKEGVDYKNLYDIIQKIKSSQDKEDKKEFITHCADACAYIDKYYYRRDNKKEDGENKVGDIIKNEDDEDMEDSELSNSLSAIEYVQGLEPQLKIPDLLCPAERLNLAFLGHTFNDDKEDRPLTLQKTNVGRVYQDIRKMHDNWSKAKQSEYENIQETNGDLSLLIYEYLCGNKTFDSVCYRSVCNIPKTDGTIIVSVEGLKDKAISILRKQVEKHDFGLVWPFFSFKCKWVDESHSNTAIVPYYTKEVFPFPFSKELEQFFCDNEKRISVSSEGEVFSMDCLRIAVSISWSDVLLVRAEREEKNVFKLIDLVPETYREDFMKDKYKETTTKIYGSLRKEIKHRHENWLIEPGEPNRNTLIRKKASVELRRAYGEEMAKIAINVAVIHQ